MALKKAEEHKKLISVLKKYLEKQGYKIKIEPQTKEYAGVKPDMEAIKDGEILKIEVVNGKNLDNISIRKKWEAISGDREGDFSIFVTKEKEKEVKKLLDKWDIYFRKIWLYAPKTP